MQGSPSEISCLGASSGPPSFCGLQDRAEMQDIEYGALGSAGGHAGGSQGNLG